MTDSLWIDLETRSRVDLPKTGVYRYAQCPDFKILMAGWTGDGETVRVDLEQDDIRDIPGLRDSSVRKVAHNANFERICFSRFFGLPSGKFLPPEEWHDTQAIAGELGWPQSLARLAKALRVEEKDSAGTRLINLFCKPNRKGEWNDETTHPMEWLDFIAYNEQDVLTLVAVDRKLGDWPTETERAVFMADQRVNDRGIPIDVPMARRAAKVGAMNTAKQKERVSLLAGVDNPGSQPQMMDWVEGQGLSRLLPNLQAETVTKALESDHLNPKQREVLELRQELALAAPAKFSTAVSSQVDGRLRGTLKFFGAHTGRWAGRGTQVQNLPRSSFEHDVDVELAIHDLMSGKQIPSEELKKLVRPMFIGPFTVVDFKAIEAVVIAWLAGEEWVLQAFRDGRDIYVENAEKMGGLTRPQGKIAVLALNYNGGPGSLRAMSGDHDRVPVGSLQATGKSSTSTGSIGEDTQMGKLIKHATDNELYDLFVYPYRNANANIVRLWKRLESKFRTGGQVGDFLSFEKHGKDRLLRLPSGRAIAYRDCGIQRDAGGRERLKFSSPMGMRVDTYGGRLAENATQAVARDIEAEAIVRLEERGFAVVGHVHDEIIVEGEHDVDEIIAIATQVPTWAAGMPIDGAGFTCDRYKKG